jgi:hypothetical protein
MQQLCQSRWESTSVAAGNLVRCYAARLFERLLISLMGLIRRAEKRRGSENCYKCWAEFRVKNASFVGPI